MRPALTLPKEFAIRVLTSYVPLHTARELATFGGTALVIEEAKVITVEPGKLVTIK